MKLARSFLYVVLFTLILMVSTATASAQTENYLHWTEQQNVNPHHNWSVNFNYELNETTMNSSNIYVRHNDEKVEGINLELNADKKSVTLSAPTEGYQAGQVYHLYIEPSVKSTKGKNLKQPIIMKFTIQNNLSPDNSMILDKFLPGLNWGMDQEQTEHLMSTLDNVKFDSYFGKDKLEVDYRVNDTYSLKESSWLYIFFKNKGKEIDFFNFADSTNEYLVGEEMKVFNEEYVKILSEKIGEEPTFQSMVEWDDSIKTTWETEYERLNLYVHTPHEERNNNVIFTIRRK